MSRFGYYFIDPLGTNFLDIKSCPVTIKILCDNLMNVTLNHYCLVAEPTFEGSGPLRRCSTKRYALVRQSKVVGEKQRPAKIRERRGSSPPHEDDH